MLNQKSLHINIESCNKNLHIATLKEIQKYNAFEIDKPCHNIESVSKPQIIVFRARLPQVFDKRHENCCNSSWKLIFYSN